MKVLLVQTSFLGDNILSTPVIPGIKKICGECSLTVLTTKLAAAVYEGNALVDEVLVFDKRGSHKGIGGIWRLAKKLREEKFDRVYSLHRSARTAFLLFLSRIPERIGFQNASLRSLYTEVRERPTAVHEVDRNLALLKPEYDPPEGEKTLCLPHAKEGAAVIEELSGKAVSSYAVLVPGSVWATKRWSAKEFRQTAVELLDRGQEVVLLGAPNEVEIAREVSADLSVIDLSGKTSLSQMFSIVADAALVVCNDSMSLHVASTFQVPTVVVFCATSPAFGFGPWLNEKARVVEKEGLHCKPCRRHGSNRCPEGTNACMDGVPASRVIEKVSEVTGWQ